jgi:hypothetical protein
MDYIKTECNGNTLSQYIIQNINSNKSLKHRPTNFLHTYTPSPYTHTHPIYYRPLQHPTVPHMTSTPPLPTLISHFLLLTLRLPYAKHLFSKLGMVAST